MRPQGSIYSDLDLTFTASPLTGDLVTKTNQEALKRAIRHMFQLNAFDVPFNSSIRCNIKNYLFEGNNQLVRSSIEEEIQWVAKKVEPRIKISDVDIEISSNQRQFDITVTYKIQSMNVQDSFNFTVERVR